MGADVWGLLQDAWKRSDQLFGLIKPEYMYERPIGLRHPILFYVGHLPAFASNMIITALLDGRPHDAAFDSLFAFGIDPDDDAEASQESFVWPELAKVVEYRDAVRAQVLSSREDVASLGSRSVMTERDRMLHLVLEHEMMHHETLLYMLQEMPYHMKSGSLGPAVTGARQRPPSTTHIPGGPITLGVDLRQSDFVWDNEVGEHTVHVEPFVLSDTPVTIGDYLDFVENGGYEKSDWWSKGGWAWSSRRGMKCPKDWVRRDGEVYVRAMSDKYPIGDVLGWPVCVSWAEAEAFARWKGGRLPTEAELCFASYITPSGEGAEYPWGAENPRTVEGAFDFRVCSPVPVGSSPQADSAWGIAELVGNGWEWTSTLFQPYPGFTPYVEAYPGYSADFFDDKHYVVFGASWATDARLLRRSFRNWYRYNYPYPFTKFRIAHDA